MPRHEDMNIATCNGHGDVKKTPRDALCIYDTRATYVKIS